MPLPRGMTQSDFDDAMNAFRRAVGSDWVFTDDEMLNSYRDGYSPWFGTDDEVLPSAAVAPANVEEVQAVVRIANEFGIPFWVNSTGRNFGYGGPTGVVQGTVNLDLKRMNRILELNEEHAYVVVEPGVSFIELQTHLAERGSKLWMDTPGPGWGSVIGNSLEHGMGYTNYSERVKYICGMEVVLPDGDLLRTGMGAVESAGDLWHQFQMGLGPYVDGIFTQTSLGVVTKMGLWLQPEPPAFLSVDVTAPGYESIEALVDATRPLRHAQVIPNNATFKPRFGDQQFGGLNDGPEAVTGWINEIAFYGLAQVVDANWEHAREQFSAIPGVEFDVRRHEAPYDRSTFDRRDSARAGLATILSAAHPVFFSVILPFRGSACLDLFEVLDDVAQQYDRRFAGSWTHADGPRSLITTPGGPIRMGDLEFNRTSMALTLDWIEATAARGWGAYRASTVIMDEAMSAYNFNDNAIVRFNEKLKDALDPNGILAPGKNGIWPKGIRNA